ncbi:glycosyltransferase family 2 protein [Salibacterium halotolerans]|uniref:Glycosyl transferase family 2 n=1 Tax=Salibacterium halotolerans TaxID=1884432 RepID=A0A1I5XIH1_9BACI|nr:glycosyltransferase family A protein [Salibacterium halotolerans]SFQ31759.1 Glycosyl transferase family 2 [Salibacterium halotolerans]
MNDITALLFGYSNRKTLQQALCSLEKIHHRINMVMVLDPAKQIGNEAKRRSFDVSFIPEHDPGSALNRILSSIKTSYILFLHDDDYISSSFQPSYVNLDPYKSVMTVPQRIGRAVIEKPFLIRTSIGNQNPFPSIRQLPFREALLPAWLSALENHHLTAGQLDGLKKINKNTSKSEREKIHFLTKYETTSMKSKTPSLSIFIANYNMGSYVETALLSCILQNVQPESVFIIDDGSTDDSRSRLSEWKNHPRVTFIAKENGGKAKALNDVLPRVSTEFVMELDADDWLDPDAVSMVKHYLQDLPEPACVLYGNLRRWKQTADGGVLYKGLSKGRPVRAKNDLLSYRFPLGPRIYRTSTLKQIGGFPVVPFEHGRLYEDVSVLMNLFREAPLFFQDFTVYNVREHKESITKKNHSKWNDFYKSWLGTD